jgi:predicted nucleic acid-binding protein
VPAVCLDASAVLLSFLREPASVAADALFESWRESNVELIGPHMLALEVPSALRQAVHRGKITSTEGDQSLEVFLRMPIRIREPRDIVQRAWNIGKGLDSPRLYDMYYLALAENEKCELWTADRRLVNLANPRYHFVKWVGQGSSQ